MNKRPLQIVLAVLGAIPIITGALDIILGSGSQLLLDPSIPPPHPLIDSQIRFFGAIWLSVGVILYWLIPSIEKFTTLFRILAASIFLGGLGRVMSIFVVGMPPAHIIGLLALELIGMPILVLWQSRLNASD